MKLDGSLCSLPRSSAFELGVAAIAFLLVAQLVGTSAAVTTAYAAAPKKSAAARSRVAFVALLGLSWYVQSWRRHVHIRIRNSCDRSELNRVGPALLLGRRLSFAVAVILLATAASMNHGQRYGRGWMDGDCYVARNGVFGAAAALVVVTALTTIGLAFTTEPTAAAAAMAPAPASPAAAPDACASRTHLEAAAADAEQPGGRSKQ